MFAQMVLAAALAQLLVLWLLGDPRLSRAVAGLFATRQREGFAAGEDAQPDWGPGAAFSAPPPRATSPSVAATAGSRDPPGASLRTRDWKQAPAAWAPPPRRAAPVPDAVGGWDPLDPVGFPL